MTGPISRGFIKLFFVFARYFAKQYLKKDRNYRYNGLKLRIFKDVFHPGFFRSTKVFAGWLEKQHLQGINLLELGAGSGLISLVAARKGAVTTAVDINQKAVDNVQLNASMNDLKVHALHSDLFTALPPNAYFDMVLINPPYYAKKPTNDYQRAWYCGEHFEYFHALFRQLTNRHQSENHYMILSNSCNMEKINGIARENGLVLENIFEQKVAGETLTIFQVRPPISLAS
ncbi:MAG: rsmC [Chitinophagaceae bacterium]|nr:rsmC [Chitinophagaceae bacterium]